MMVSNYEKAIRNWGGEVNVDLSKIHMEKLGEIQETCQKLAGKLGSLKVRRQSGICLTSNRENMFEKIPAMTG